MRVHYPFHKLKTNKTSESLTVQNVQKNNSSAQLPHFNNTISLTEYAQENGTFILKTVIKLVSFKLHSTKYNNSVVSVQKSDLMNLEEFVKHSLLKHLAPELDYLTVKVDYSNYSIKVDNLTVQDFPICLNLTIKSEKKITEEQYQIALMDLSVNKEDCQFNRTESSIKCYFFNPKTKISLLRYGDYWIQFHVDSDVARAELLKLDNELFIFTYNSAWVIGLAIIGGIIGLFFIGCIVAICYTRRPYRRSGKVYEVEKTQKKSAKIPQMPAVHPTTKASTVTKNKELYY